MQHGNRRPSTRGICTAGGGRSARDAKLPLHHGRSSLESDAMDNRRKPMVSFSYWPQKNHAYAYNIYYPGMSASSVENLFPRLFCMNCYVCIVLASWDEARRAENRMIQNQQFDVFSNFPGCPRHPSALLFCGLLPPSWQPESQYNPGLNEPGRWVPPHGSPLWQCDPSGYINNVQIVPTRVAILSVWGDGRSRSGKQWVIGFVQIHWVIVNWIA